MKNLLPHAFKKIGWFILIPALFVGVGWLLLDADDNNKLFNWPVFALVSDPLFEENWQFAHFIQNNVLDELIALWILAGCVLVAFSREAVEDEYIMKVRLDSLLWATYFNCGALAFCILFVYDMAFYWVMIINLFALLLFFIVRFNWYLLKMKRGGES
ncbi:hypothetical protein LAG90_03165 [Marinilongibacter aquaticus]|uniref:hypothetical protein n=1 Tax=Marinilongibacter aquaticus TaxID=2975157 RepID=UPI0021BD4160|nr:hypothetical protein [Marinilongibacter aquaticus]UBM59650.1 hypothetical protein LAG90_03165 [Marinilongibacter aquaticus]